jgi:DivIVA domain-containing protein
VARLSGAVTGPSRPTEGDVLVLVLEVLAGTGVLFLVAVLATGRAGAMTGAAPDRAPVALPEGRPLTGADLSRVRFGVALRGYRMDDVDAVLDRLATEIGDRDVRHAAPEDAPASGTDSPSGADAATGGPDPAGSRPDDPRGSPAVPAPPAVPPLPGPDAASSGPLTVPPAAWEGPYATAWGEDSAAWGEDSAAWGEDGAAWGEDGDGSSGDDAWYEEVAGAGDAEEGTPDEPRDQPTEEWRSLYDALRPAEPAPRDRGAGPRRIGGAWERQEPQEGTRNPAAPDDGTEEDEGGPWPSSW